MTLKYVPTLGEYAVIIEWLATHPGEGVPVHMEKAFKDALVRAALRSIVAELAGESSR